MLLFYLFKLDENPNSERILIIVTGLKIVQILLTWLYLRIIRCRVYQKKSDLDFTSQSDSGLPVRSGL